MYLPIRWPRSAGTAPRIHSALRRLLIAASIILAAGAPLHPSVAGGHSRSRTSPPGSFVEVSQALGIDVTPTGTRSDWGHGAAFCDYDGDGDLDLYVVMEDSTANRLYRNDGAAGFVDVAAAAGVGDPSNGRAVVWADYDNDGDRDLFVSNDLDPNRLYRNNGDGTFTDVTAAAGVGYVGRCHSAAWADYDNDGDVDLFVGNYGIVSTPRPNLLFHNNGDGTFTDVAAAAGVDDPTKPALACTWIDYDDDSDPDLYIAYDKTRGNVLYRNNGDGTFTDVSAASNTDIAFNAMGIAVADYDHNGTLDMYVTNTPEGNELLHNNGDGTFTHMAVALGVTVNRISWGTAFLDYDNDGDDDLYVVNWGMAGPGPDTENVLFRNDGGTFADVTATAGVGDQNLSYAVTVGDYNDDGHPDIFVNNMNTPSKFFECVPGTYNWLKVRTEGTTSNRDGIGAKVRVVAGPLDQMKDVRAGSSYLSQLSPELEFGLATQTLVDSLIVRWPSGLLDVWTDVAVNQTFLATEGGSPVPVLITRFGARVRDGAVALDWSVFSDEAFLGYRIYRTGGTNGREAPLDTGGLIAPAARRFVDETVRPGARYGYVLAVVQADGSELRSPRVEATVPPAAFGLAQNYPNPFNPVTSIRFTLPDKQRVELGVFDARGRRVITLLDAVRTAGPHSVVWDGRDDGGRAVATGVYFYRLRAGGVALTRKMILLK